MVDAGHFEKKTGRSRLVLMITAAMLVAALFLGGSVLFLVDRERGLVILKANQDPYKVRPSDPGGKKLDNLDSPVLGLLDPLDEKDTGREVLTPPETAPEPPPISLDGETTEDTSTDTADGPAATEEGGTVSADATTPETAPAAEDEDNVADTGGEEETEVASVEDDAASAEEPSEPAPGRSEVGEAGSSGGEIDDAVAQVSGARDAPADADGGYFVVQFAAFKSEKNATDTAAVLASKHASRLNGIGIGYLRRGEYWRVVTDPLSRPDASEMCSMFRSVGQDCIVKLVEPEQ